MEEDRKEIIKNIPSSSEGLSIFMNSKENENESFHFSNVIKKESGNKQNSDENQKLFPTKVFMKYID